MLDLIYKKFVPNSKILDLGCGSGEDILFLAQQGFTVLGIDKSEEAIKEITEKIKELNLANIKLEKSDIRDYIIEPEKFDVIICKNVLNFIDKDQALKIINDIKNKIKKGGYILIQVFTIEDPSFNKRNRFISYFEIKELFNLFTEFEICFYFEDIISDPGHPGFEIPHKHGVSRIIVKK